MRLDELEELLGDKIEIEWKSFLLRVEPKTGDREEFIEYTRSWLRPAELEPATDFRIWTSDESQPESSIPAQVAYKVLSERWPALARAYHRRLLTAYFTENRNIGDSQVLLDLAVEVGVDRDAFAEAAAQGAPEMTQLVIEEHNAAIENGVTAVPTVVFEHSFPVPGAQPVETYERLVEAIVSNRSDTES